MASGLSNLRIWLLHKYILYAGKCTSLLAHFPINSIYATLIRLVSLQPKAALDVSLQPKAAHSTAPAWREMNVVGILRLLG